MYKRIIILLALFLCVSGQLLAHSGKPKFHVIIDTDGALDDMRSLSMFLSGNQIEVMAITCSQGSLLPDSIYLKVKSLLSDFHHEGIPVGINEETGRNLPVWAPFSQSIDWGSSPEIHSNFNGEDATMALERTTKNFDGKIILIALGSLKTYADWFMANPNAIKMIERIIWYNNHEIEKGFNYKASPESFDYIKKTGTELEIVGNNSDKFPLDNEYLTLIENTNSMYAKQIDIVHKQSAIVERIHQKHLQFWDDLVPLYLSDPTFFKSEIKGNIKLVSLDQETKKSLLYYRIGELIESSSETNNRVFNNFPVDTSLYKPEYAKMLSSTLERFGPIEWKAICMTNEIHGHTGIYSIIGAKMGIRAMEYFNIGVNNLMATTFAGNKPPLSCFNDGVQISTGATIGQGLITISDTILKIPTAIFEYDNHKIKISVKPDVIKQMQQDIKFGVETYGLKSEEYWLYIEKLAINYWNEHNRWEIFDIEQQAR